MCLTHYVLVSAIQSKLQFQPRVLENCKVRLCFLMSLGIATVTGSSRLCGFFVYVKSAMLGDIIKGTHCSVPLFALGRTPWYWLFHSLGRQQELCFDNVMKIQGVPLATEPAISLIIVTPMKRLQWNLNRITFVVWEMKRNVSVVRLIVAPSCKIIKEMPVSVASGTHCILHITCKRPQDISFWKEFKCSCCIYLFTCMLNSWHYGSDNIPVLVQHWPKPYITSCLKRRIRHTAISVFMLWTFVLKHNI